MSREVRAGAAGDPASAGRQPLLLRASGLGLLIIACASGAMLLLLAAGLGGTFRFGSVAITVNDFHKPLAWGGIAALGLLAQEWGRRPRRLAAIGLIVALALLAIVNFARDLPPITTDSDFAVTELYTELATRGRLLVGPYSRFGWHHPGPLYFYVQAPLYALSGHRATSLYAGALAINLLALITIAWVTGRQARGLLPVCVIFACVIFAWRVPRLLASPWTAHVPILPSLAFTVLCAAVASGQWKLLPLTVVAGSFIAQTHLALVPMTAVVSAGLIAILLLRQGRNPRLLSALNTSAWLCLALWLLPISEAVTRGGGNVAALLEFFVISPEEGQSLRAGFIHWTYGLTALLRPDLALPWGGHIALQNSWWVVPCALAQVILTAAIARHDLASGRTFEAYLASAALMASCIGLWALTRIRGDILDHEIFWLGAVGALNLAVIAAAALRAVPKSRAGWWQASALTNAACSLLLLISLGLGVQHLRDLTSFELRRTERNVILSAHQAIRDYVLRENIQRPLIRVDNARWSEAAGVVLRLYRDGTDFAVPAEWFPMFTDAFAANGREDAIITIGSPGVHLGMSGRLAHVVLLDSNPVYVDAIKTTPTLTH